MGHIELRVKGIILDLDGTLVDSRGAYLEAAKTAFAISGLEEVDTRTVTEIPKRLVQNMSIASLVKGINVNEFLKTYLKAYYKFAAEKTKPFPDVDRTLAKLSEKAKLALTTRRNVHRKEVTRELQKFGLAKYFETVMTSMDTEKPKPSPEPLMKCSEQLGISPRDCVAVGDSIIDMVAGKNAGTKTVAVLSGIFSLSELKRAKPDLILESVNLLPDFLE